VYFGLPDDALALREGLREVLATACTPAVIRAAWEGSDSAALWKELGSFGLIGLLVPEGKGGLGLDALAMVAALEEAGYYGVPGPLVDTVSFLPALDLPCDGTARVAVQQVGGKLVPHAGVATHVYREDDLTLLSAFATEPVEAIDRSRRIAKVLGESTLDPSMLTGSYDAAEGAVSPAPRQLAILGTAAFLLGLARRQVEMTVAYVKERKQFGVPVGSFQAIKHPLADAVVGTEFAWPAVLRAAQSLAVNEPNSQLHVSMAKALCSDAAYRVSRVCLQAHGAMGYTVEYDLHLFAKRTWALAKDWGTADQHRAIVARALREGTAR
jgi:alkylation response protein AidB-like acyl-CoA dehydrogenase